ncbi:MAG: MFS transporter [Clostridiales bacterium]
MLSEKLFTKDFTLILIGQIISLFGNAILRFALPLYLLRETGSASLFGIVTACSFLPMIFLSFFGGILADRVNKRNIMVALDFITALVVFSLYFLLGHIPIVPLFIVVLILLYGISGTYQPTVQASIPALMSSENILPASAIINQIGAISGLLGPIIGGALFGAFGIMPILVISIFCFLFSAIMEIFITIPYTKRSENFGICTIIKNDFHDSLNYITHEKPLLLKIIILIAVFNLVLSAMIIVGIPILIINTLKMSDSLLGITQGAMALGGFCGGIFTAMMAKKLKFENSHFLLLICGITVGIMAIPLFFKLENMIGYISITILSFLAMAFATIFTVQMLAKVQKETPPELVGKVIALMMSIAMCAQPLGQVLYGFAFDIFPNNSGFILTVAGLLSVISAFILKKIIHS